MINGLGVLGWGVGGIEAEAAMLGQTISMVLPEVVGVCLTGVMPDRCNATDLVLTLTEILRKRGVVGKFVEFFGSGCLSLSLADRATIANMSPEYGATMGYFPVDEKTVEYLVQTGRTDEQVEQVVTYLKSVGLYKTYNSNEDDSIVFSGEIIKLDLGTIVACMAGPKRPHDRVAVDNLKNDFVKALTNKPGFKGYGLKPENSTKKFPLKFKNESYTLEHGSVVIAAITSCTNTSNPEVMIASGLVAKKAVELGLKVKPYIKTSLSPGSGVVTKYLEISGVLKYLEQLGFNLAGYGCMTCIGNSGELVEEVIPLINEEKLITASVLSGNRNFEGRVHNLVQANYLASPPLVVAYALAGTVNIDLETEEIGKDKNGNSVFLKDIWPTKEEIGKLMSASVKPQLFKEVYTKISKGTDNWNSLNVNITY